MNETNINDIDLSKYFKNHYDNGKLYCVEYKGSPLELQRAIKRLQEENEELKETNKSIAKDYIDVFGDYQKYKRALEEIKEIIEFCFKAAYLAYRLEGSNKIIEDIEKIVNEVLNDQTKKKEKE